MAGKSAGVYDVEIADASLAIVVNPAGPKGDANNNGSINIVDAQITYDFATGKLSAEALAELLDCWGQGATVELLERMLDVNENGAVDAGDARAIQVYVHTGSFKAEA